MRLQCPQRLAFGGEVAARVTFRIRDLPAEQMAITCEVLN
jgi:hypothetical protein